MFETLYIAEKPGVGRAIAQNLGGKMTAVRGQKGVTHYIVGDVAVSHAFGHILKLAEPEDYDPSFRDWEAAEARYPFIPETWKLNVIQESAEQLAVLRDLVKKSKRIVHAGDPDREGQLLIDEILEYLGNSAPVSRILPNAIDDGSMKAILKDVRDNRDFRGLYEAGLGRQRADWVVGMNLTRACTVANRRTGLRGMLSVGRVQTPTLAMVVKRDLEIENFKPQTFFQPVANLKHANGHFKAEWKAPENFPGLDSEKRLIDPVAARAIDDACKGQTGKIAEYKVERKEERCPLPFSLTTLQIKASKLYRMSASTVLDICQSLYEIHKITSYPRSDCPYLPESQLGDVPAVLRAISSFNADSAALVAAADAKHVSHAWDSKLAPIHHGIIPTTNANYASLSEPEKKIFSLICKQYLAQFYPAYTFMQTSVLARCGGHEFKASGRTPVDFGWRKVFGASDVDDDEEKAKGTQQMLPKMERGDSVVCVSVAYDKKLTKAPARFTEGTLIRAMTNVHELVEDPVLKERLKQSKGIGTVATQGKILQKLHERNYVATQSGAVVSTAVGRAFVKELPRDLTEVHVTAIWELALEQVIKGQLQLSKFLEGQALWIHKLTRQALSKSTCIAVGFGNETVNAATMKALADASGAKCPKCGNGHLRAAQARQGENKGRYFLACSTYPDCDHTSDIAGQQAVSTSKSSRGGSKGGAAGKRRSRA